MGNSRFERFPLRKVLSFFFFLSFCFVFFFPAVVLNLFYFIIFFNVACHFWNTFSFQLISFQIISKCCFSLKFGPLYRLKEVER